ncbi:PREDICTED: cytochrome P450 6j1-like [Dinoponera quadriceps]|uniref:Cytochrome P450 6j1-like n=1 Tax=Dinoponera quadriceps TaxID=609295 RepID=A0A6P3WQQ8_DINQU|nr:PREDICTED: cytochrome P450 6j1-like [Dinoponera quadriceps]
MVILLFTFVLGSIVAAYIYLTKNYNYWRDRNIPCAKGTLPGFGHTLPLLVMRTTLGDLVQRICDPYPDRSMVGFYHQTTPALVIREPELVKTVLQTNFASFSRNTWKIDSQLDRLNVAHPFLCYGDTWLISRKHMGLAFTTRSLKIFLNRIQQVCINLENYLNDKLKANNNTIELELNSLACRYTTSVAAYTSLSVENKIREEVRTVLAKYDGQLSYYALKEMTYIDQVINESQRLYPILPCMGKICTEEFELKSSDGLSCRIHPGTEIFVNVYEIHRNPKYWPNPEVFDPDRFSSERRTEIQKYTFLPFGEGPRICVAMRMAMLQTKAYLALIMKNYTLELSSKTPKEPLKFMPGSFLLKSVSDLWVHLKPL